MVRTVRVVLVILLALLGLSGVAQAAPLANVVGDGTPGSCTETAFVTALTAAGTITFKCGSSPVTITLTSTKTISSNVSVTIQGGNLITLSGGGTTSLFTVMTGATLSLSDIVLDKAAHAGGGGTIGSSGTLNLTNVTVQNSKTSSVNVYGGAIYTDGPLNITNSTFQNNISGSGGAIFALGPTQITNSRFLFNHAQDSVSGGGGAVEVAPPGKLDVSGGEFNGNTAIFGGAVYLAGDIAGTPQAIFHSSGQPISFSANSATRYGGAIYNEGPDLQITNADFIGNAVSQNATIAHVGYGGAIYNQGHMLLNSSLLESNKATFGGAVYIGTDTAATQYPQFAQLNGDTLDSNAATSSGGGLLTDGNNTNVIVDNSSIAHNTADGGAGLAVENATFTLQFSSVTSNQAVTAGGGVSLRASPQPTSGGTIQLYDSTIAQNSAPKGAGIYNLTGVTLKNVTLVGNTNDGLFNSGTLEAANVYNSVLQNTLNCATDGLINTFSGGANFSTDLTCHFNAVRDRQGADLVPQLGPLTNQNSLTWYEPPLAGSPLIDAALPPCSATDQLLHARSGACTIGAVEYSAVAAGTPVANTTSTTNPTQPGGNPPSGTASPAATSPSSGTPTPAATFPPVSGNSVNLFLSLITH
jgi:predicted outer membrane repeat protein